MKRLFIYYKIVLFCGVSLCLFSCSVNEWNNDDAPPSYGVSLQVDKDTLLFCKGSTNSLIFSVNPPELDFESCIDSTDCDVSLMRIDEFKAQSLPFKIVSIEKISNSNKYLVLVEDLENANTYEENIKLRIYYKKGDQKDSLISKPILFLCISDTRLPKLYIDTPDYCDILSKDEWVKDASFRVVMPNGAVDSQGLLSIKGRGNTSWQFPKKSYTLKLNEKTEILNIPEHKRWVLLANWMDRTLLRNAVSFEIARKTSLDWTPHGVFVDVIFNGVSVGNYYLCEQIRVDKKRVNISELHINDVDAQTIQGGYLLELDKYYDEDLKFRSSVYDLPYMIKYPEKEDYNAAQFKYISDYISEMELCLSDSLRLQNLELLT